MYLFGIPMHQHIKEPFLCISKKWIAIKRPLCISVHGNPGFPPEHIEVLEQPQFVKSIEALSMKRSS